MKEVKSKPGHWGGSCPHCGQSISQEYRAKKIKEKGDAVSQKLQARRDAGLPVGRPRKVCKKTVVRLRKQGLSIRAIAREMGVSSYPVLKVVQEFSL